MFSVESAVSYFVHKKFGFLAATYPVMASLDKDKNSAAHRKLTELENFRDELRSMPIKELEQRYIEMTKQDATQAKLSEEQAENQRFYNLQTSNADFGHWSKAAHWTLDEAIALSFGKEPEIVTWQSIEQYKQKSAFVKAYAKRRDLALRATRWKKFGDTIPPIIFISWAKEVHIDLPNVLVDEVTKIGGIAINWHDQYLKLKAGFDALVNSKETKQKPESTRKTENLLQALVCIAIDEYGHIPESEKSTSPKEISDALNRQGKSVDPKTIRGWLREGFELLPAKSHKD